MHSESFCKDVFDRILRIHGLVFKSFRNGEVVVANESDINEEFWICVGIQQDEGVIVLNKQELRSPFRSLIELWFLDLRPGHVILACKAIGSGCKKAVVLASRASCVEELLVNADLLAAES